MRQFISVLERAGRLTRVTREVSWKYEIGDILKATRSPLLFENIAGYPGKRLFTNGLIQPATIALALGLEESSPLKETARVVAERFRSPIVPVMVDRAPVKELVITGGDIDLTALPVPWWSREDGQRYVGTWHLNITVDPESGRRNVGVYRMMLAGKDAATVSFSPRSHLSRHVAKAEKAGAPLAMAVAIGVSETLMISAGAAPPYGVDELALAGGLAGKPVELTKCSTIAMEVPASSEIVLEGIIETGRPVSDGPYMDYAGVTSVNPDCRLFRVSAISMRSDAIFRGTAVGRPGAEDHMLYCLLSKIGMTDFHGSRIRHRVQTALLRHQAFRLFQLAGRAHRIFGSKGE